MKFSRNSNCCFLLAAAVLVASAALTGVRADKNDTITTVMPSKAEAKHHHSNETKIHSNDTELHSNETATNRHGNVTVEAKTVEEPEELPRRNFTAITPEKCEKEVPTGKLVGVRIAANCTTGRCQLPSNSSIKVEIDFDPGENTDILTPKIYGMIGPVEIAFPGLRKNVCDSVKSVEGKSCPLMKGTVYTYRREIPIKDEYPPIRVGVKWKFITDHNTTSICFVIKSEIVDHDLA